MAAFFGSLVKSFILPKPSPTYSADKHPGKLVHIPRVDWDTRKENGTFTYGLLLLDTAAKFIIIYAHTNAVDVAMVFETMSYVSKRTSTSVLLVEYTGYGIAYGETTERSMNEDVLSAYYYAVRHMRVPADRVVLMGRSIGTGPSAQVCALLQGEEEVPALLVLQSPFTSLKECANDITPNVGSIVGYLGYDWFRTIDVVAQVRCPIIIHHGQCDDVVPFEHAQQLKRTIEEATPPGVVELHAEPNRGHNDLPTESANRFIDKKLRSFGQPRCLQPRCRPYHLVNPSIYEYLFCVKEQPIINMEELLKHWNETLSIGSFAYKREKLYVLLTASVSLFAMRCARAWQHYAGSRKRHYGNSYIASCNGSVGVGVGVGVVGGSGSGGNGDGSGSGAEELYCAKEDIIKRCLACWGSPLGAYLSVRGPPIRYKIFGVHLDVCVENVVASDGISNESGFRSCGGNPYFLKRDTGEAYLSVAELEFTHGLTRSVAAAMSTAPTLGGEEDEMDVFLQKNVVTRIQTQCERVVAFLDSNEWENMLEVLVSFGQRAPSFLSSKALQYYSECSSQARFGDSCGTGAACCGNDSGPAPRSEVMETIEDVDEWLRPWVVSPDTRMQLGTEVPWDYYLLKARLCVVECTPLGPDTSWEEARRITDAWRVVKIIHDLFCSYSRRVLHPSFSAS
ncbi:serine peptidase [Trypanosoma brucei equiperdum]|uniref:Serine peptidase n=1 Tax=Trypanosoma brucei equiperdum TaxID=630700 RepID=A0A3L6LDR5_9TRYP|nr:serine peptidase [Trypanosoma brucei equiperdum]